MLIDPKSLGPNAIAIEMAATMVGVSADDVSTFSCALICTPPPRQSRQPVARFSRKKKPGRMNYDKEDHASRVR